MHWSQNRIFINEAGFNMLIRRNFSHSKTGMPVKAVVPSNRGVTMTIIGAVCKKGIVELTLCKPNVVQKKNNGTNE
ncbi:hypothetical protein A0J61_06095 [Choanephora cucurbitarum]|uniref:Uncharacterized protein n=1 Tax=Choanephora cucurbitarum TaxID=101091 RepID=A0A1C7NEW0_9FUNG|nr:hypothetical protein A0J61_06095 [Choanephora cucurbitarum]